MWLVNIKKNLKNLNTEIVCVTDLYDFIVLNHRSISIIIVSDKIFGYISIFYIGNNNNTW